MPGLLESCASIAIPLLMLAGSCLLPSEGGIITYDESRAKGIEIPPIFG